jgi:DNA-binding NtrC family response regulator
LKINFILVFHGQKPSTSINISAIGQRLDSTMSSILIVDDDNQIQRFLSKLFAKDGYDTMIASDGSEAIEIYRKNRQDVVIMDIVMPKKEGIETIIELKKIDQEVKIIAISGGGKAGGISYLKMAMSLGAVAGFEKPINIPDLRLKISELI